MEIKDPQYRIAVLRPSSFLVYHLDSRNSAPGKKAASTKPRKNRVSSAPTKLWVMPVRIDIVPQIDMQNGSQSDGRPVCCTIIFDGICGA